MLVCNPISPAAAAYYFGDQGPGQWVGRGAEALGLSGVVEHRALVAVLRGCHPDEGRFLPAKRPARRRAGWDLIFAAPKSVSLVGGLTPEARDTLVAAQRTAVDGSVVDFERRMLRLRRVAAPGGETSSVGLVAAAFQHRSNASGEPHLHTHLLVINLGRDSEGVWSAISPTWWPARRSVGAVYQLGLRHQLSAVGLELDWRIRPDGLADLADVPRAAIRGASSRGRAAAADRAAFADSHSRHRSGIRTGATIQTRRSATGEPWEARACAAGFGPDQAAQLLRNGRSRSANRYGPLPSAGATMAVTDSPNYDLPKHSLPEAVTSWLASQRSSFRQSDVLLGLAACAPDGMPAPASMEWTDQFCQAAIPVTVPPGAVPRWTTLQSSATDQLLLARTERLRGQRDKERDRDHDDALDQRVGAARHHELGPDSVEAALARHRSLSSEGKSAAEELLDGAGGIRILHAPPGRANLLAQASVLEAAGTAWRAAGMRVAVATSDPMSAGRWRALTGIPRHHVGRSADVVIVDQADRRTTPELLAMLSDLDRAGAEMVIVEGGTRPRLSWMCSDALATIGDRLGRLDPGPTPRWADDLQPEPNLVGRQFSGSGLEPGDDGVVAYPTSGAAVRGLLASWRDAWSPSAPAVLIGLGYAEADGLNQAARTVLARDGEISGPHVSSHGMALQSGDRLLALRRVGPDLPRGTSLHVTEVDPDRSLVNVRWGRKNATLGPGATAHLGYGYAVTPRLAAQTNGPLIVLGPPEALGPHRARVTTAAAVVPGRDLGLDRSLAPRRPLGRRPELDRGYGLSLG